MRVLAPAKLNLCLYLGGRTDEGLHRLLSIFEPLSLADELDVSPAEKDEVVCPGIDGVNLAEEALVALRGLGWRGDPVRIGIEKHIPVAAGLGGGSADAAAVLRLGGGDRDGLAEAALALGADIPSQLAPALSLVEGVGEQVERLPAPEPHGVLLLPGGGGLLTADVFAEADRVGVGRNERDLAGIRLGLRAATASGTSPLAYTDLLINDLQAPAISLRPDIEGTIEALESAGAGAALLSGSGPTAFGLFSGVDDAERAAARIGRDDAIVCEGGRPL